MNPTESFQAVRRPRDRGRRRLSSKSSGCSLSNRVIYRHHGFRQEAPHDAFQVLRGANSQPCPLDRYRNALHDERQNPHQRWGVLRHGGNNLFAGCTFIISEGRSP